jgi:hypothetical protein
VRPWYKRCPDEFHKLKKCVTAEFPDLRVLVVNGKVQVKGSFPLILKGKTIKRYSVLIILPNDYPKSLPIVYEIGGQIPRLRDRHIHQDHGACCLFVPDERWQHFPEDALFIEFLRGPVHDFFLWQASIELAGSHLIPARAHGAEGIIESYKELLGTDNLETIVKCLDYLSRKEVKGHWRCFCGSNERLRQCHYNKLLGLRRKILPEVAKESLTHIRRWLNEKSITD